MQRLFTTLALFFLTIGAHSQSFTASGKVTDGKTGQPLTGASVFCQNTTIGTTTNSEGVFTLNLANGGYDLVISFSGYETFSKRINAGTENIGNLEIVLKQKDNSLEEVSITVTNEVKDGLAKYGDFFHEQFLGLTQNSILCQIENPETLRFFFSKKRNRLKVTAREELRVINKALGYSIRYQLDSFVHEYASGLTQYTGFPFFEELTGTEEETERWEKNREKAYYGSVLHFMRCYYDSTLRENGYKLELVDNKTNKARLVLNPYDSVFYERDSLNNAEFSYPSKLRVIYSEEKPEEKYLVKNKMPLSTTIQISLVDFADFITIEENGYFWDQRDLLTLGYWSWEKLADFLPYNYDPRE